MPTAASVEAMDWLLQWALGPLAIFVTVTLVLLLVAAPVTVWRARDASLGQAARATGRDLALAVSLVLIGTLTFAPLVEGTPRLPVNLLPFRDQLLALDGQLELSHAIAELALNVVLFVPFGMAIEWRRPRLAPVSIGLLALVVSIVVEAVQAVTSTGRQADITDLLANVGGALAGAVLVRHIIFSR